MTPQRIATESFTDADAAVDRLIGIYERNTGFLRGRFEKYVNGEARSTRVRATYPFVRILITHARLDLRLSYGFAAGPGAHETTVTRPDLFRTYLTEHSISVLRQTISIHAALSPNTITQRLT